MKRRTGVLLLAAILAGCRYGTTVEEFPPAQGPGGLILRIGTGERGLRGELIEVRGNGLVLLVGGQIWLVDYPSIEDAEPEDYRGSFGLGSGRTPAAADRDALSLLARFPQGVSTAVLDRLFEVHAQTRFRTLDDF